MEVNTFAIRTDEELAEAGGGSMEQQPFFRISNCGCGLEHCECSPGNWLSVSDGETGITLTLTDEEFEIIRRAFRGDEVWLLLTEPRRPTPEDVKQEMDDLAKTA